MVQTPLSQHLTGSLADGPLGAIAPRNWLPAAYDWLRANLLPAANPAGTQPARSAQSAAPSHPALHRLARLVPAFLVVLVVALLVGAVALLGFRAMYTDRIYPAVVVGDVNVGGLTAHEAEAVLRQRAADLEQGTILFTYN